MKWFLAKVVYRIVCGDGNHKAQFDEQLRLVSAADADEAFEKAVDMGRQESDAFYNQKEQLVQWQFVNISALYPLNMMDGAELYSQITEVDDACNYSDLVHAKARALQEKKTHSLLSII